MLYTIEIVSKRESVRKEAHKFQYLYYKKERQEMNMFMLEEIASSSVPFCFHCCSSSLLRWEREAFSILLIFFTDLWSFSLNTISQLGTKKPTITSCLLHNRNQIPHSHKISINTKHNKRRRRQPKRKKAINQF